MKYTLKQLKATLAKAPNNALHVQGSKQDAGIIVSCKHPKYATPLYVVEKGHGRTNPKLSGNRKLALSMCMNTAKNIRDNLTENYVNVELQGC